MTRHVEPSAPFAPLSDTLIASAPSSSTSASNTNDACVLDAATNNTFPRGSCNAPPACNAAITKWAQVRLFPDPLGDDARRTS